MTEPPHNGPRWPQIAAIVAVIALVGVGGLVAARSLSPSGPSGYLDASSSLVLFVQMTRSGSQLAGTISEAGISSADPRQVQTAHSSFTGIASGSSVTLTFGSELFSATNVTGTLSGSTLVLSAPAGSGSVTDYTFHAATVGAYNKAVAELDRSAAVTSQQAQRQAAAEAQAQARQWADKMVLAATLVLTGDLSRLAQDANFKSQLAATGQSLTTTQIALTKTQQKAQAVEALAQAHPNGDSGTVCADAETQVGADAQTQVEPEIQTVQSDIATVQHDLAALQSDEASAPSYHPAGLPSTATVQQAISNAQASIQAAVNTTNSDISTANGYVAAAYQAADQAIAAGHCGGGLGTPPTVSPISANTG